MSALAAHCERYKEQEARLERQRGLERDDTNFVAQDNMKEVKKAKYFEYHGYKRTYVIVAFETNFIGHLRGVAVSAHPTKQTRNEV